MHKANYWHFRVLERVAVANKFVCIRADMITNDTQTLILYKRDFEQPCGMNELFSQKVLILHTILGKAFCYKTIAISVILMCTHIMPLVTMQPAIFAAGRL